jgi:hypothetical protein
MTGLDLIAGLQAYDHPIESVFVIVGTGDTPYEVTPYPTLYTNGKRPHPNHLEALTGLDVQLIHGKEATDEVFSKWAVAAINAKPNTLIFLDSEGEIFSC